MISPILRSHCFDLFLLCPFFTRPVMVDAVGYRNAGIVVWTRGRRDSCESGQADQTDVPKPWTKSSARFNLLLDRMLSFSHSCAFILWIFFSSLLKCILADKYECSSLGVVYTWIYRRWAQSTAILCLCIVVAPSLLFVYSCGYDQSLMLFNV